MSPKLQVGDQAPDFTLPNQKGESIRLQDKIGKQVIVLFFYPKDDSPGCTIEACAFRDSYEVFQEAGAEVIGISGGSTKAKQGFAMKNRLTFTLLSDADGSVEKQFGLTKFLGLVPDRMTFVIDKQGIIRHIFSSRVDMLGHAQAALAIVKQLAKEESPA